MAKKCPYCTPDGPLGQFGNGPIKNLFDVPIKINGQIVEWVTPYIWLEENRAVLDVTLFDKLTTTKINYCPMCGRDLNKYIKELKEMEVM